MDNLNRLLESHINAGKLEKELKKERCRLMTEYKNKNNGNGSNWYIAKIRYFGLSEALKKETLKFEELLNEFDAAETTINDAAEIVDNIHYDSSSSTASTSQQTEINDLYKGSLSVEMEEEQKKESVIAPSAESKIVAPVIPAKPEKVATMKLNKNDICKKKKKENKKVSKTNNVNNPKKRKSVKVFAGYKYEGKGFEVFTGKRNKSKPIYGSILLFCEETCRGNSKLLREYLMENGKFKNEMIEEIVFKESYYYGHYSLIKVRGSLKYIQKKIKTLNKKTKRETMRLFERRKSVSVRDDMDNVSNVLYVNNFDILDKNTHKRFTKLFVSFGELVKDIKMGTDRNRDPFAIVHFRHYDDAQKCKQSENVKFDGKVLNINYSKF